MKVVKFLQGGWNPEPGRLGYSYVTTEDANVSGDYVPLADAERLASRLATLEGAIQGAMGEAIEAGVHRHRGTDTPRMFMQILRDALAGTTTEAKS